MRFSRACVPFALLLLAACDKPAEPEKGSPPPRSSGAPASPSKAGDLSWEAPATWVKAENTSPMRKATYRVPRVAGDAEDGELSISQAGGAVEQNIARWAGQLDRKPEDAKRQKKRVSGFDVTMVEIRGDYGGMSMPGAPPQPKKTGWALLGAIVETSPPTFFKLTGPEQTVLAARADFDRFIDGLKAK